MLKLAIESYLHRAPAPLWEHRQSPESIRAESTDLPIKPFRDEHTQQVPFTETG